MEVHSTEAAKGTCSFMGSMGTLVETDPVMCKELPIILFLLVHGDIYNNFLFNDSHRQSVILNTVRNSLTQWFFKVYSRTLRAPVTSAVPR